jgi:hypothetical protein
MELFVDTIEQYIGQLQAECAAASINNAAQGVAHVSRPNLMAESPEEVHRRLTVEESSEVTCPLCRDVVPRSKPQCTSVAFCNSMPIRKLPL